MSNRGGYRPGAGRPKGSGKKKVEGVAAVADKPQAPGNVSPLALMQQVVNDAEQDLQTRLRAAIAMAPFVHERRLPMGKKEAKSKAAKGATKSGRFAAAAAPRLAVVK